MQTWQVVLGVVALLWILAEAKSSRPDGKPIPTHPFRRLMFFIMPSRTESVVYIDVNVRAEKLAAWLKAVGQRFDADVSHAVVAAAGIGVAENPRMNRFVSGRRLYERKGRWLTFSMKRKQLDRKAQLSMVKADFRDHETFRQLCERVNAQIGVERSGVQTSTDKEYALFNALPRPVLAAAVPLLRCLDYYNLLPGFFIHGDGLYTGVFIANLGSIKMPSAYHHLYEWGNCPFFVAVGEIEERAVVEDGQVVVRRIMPIRITFDERIDDGLAGRYGIAAMVRVLEDPETWLGCVRADGSDELPMFPRPGQVVEDAAANAL